MPTAHTPMTFAECQALASHMARQTPDFLRVAFSAQDVARAAQQWMTQPISEGGIYANEDAGNAVYVGVLTALSARGFRDDQADAAVGIDLDDLPGVQGYYPI